MIKLLAKESRKRKPQRPRQRLQKRPGCDELPRHHGCPCLLSSNVTIEQYQYILYKFKLRTLRRGPGSGCRAARCTQARGRAGAWPPHRRLRPPTCGSQRPVRQSGQLIVLCPAQAAVSYHRLRCRSRPTWLANDGCCSSSCSAGWPGMSLQRGVGAASRAKLRRQQGQA